MMFTTLQRNGVMESYYGKSNFFLCNSGFSSIITPLMERRTIDVEEIEENF